ncbi:MAG: DEAD/DEAH box helicase [bacterium]|nr:DEAD/DEAH box helicase [bacterium]
MPFKLLSPPVKRYVRDKKWEALLPIQSAAITRIMTTGNHYILSSRTASGKTEAAFLPVISQLKKEPGVQVLYIAPLIALINDQLERIEELCQFMDIRVTRWHSEADMARKKKLLERPEGILLITPESIESLFVNKPGTIEPLFSNLKFIILDEIHSFLGTARGVQLQSLLSRLKKRARNPVRFVGLSATLRGFEEARSFFGESEKTKILRDKAPKNVEVEFCYFQSWDNQLPDDLIVDLYKKNQGKKSLIFPNSRGKVEELAVKLKKVNGRTGGFQRFFAHHSSVSKELREYAEGFAKRPERYDFSIVCTSTLELGIDIGLVDLIIQVDSVFSVSSLIQRFGRSGRKAGEKSRLLLYATNPWSLLQSYACLELYTEGFVEPVIPLIYPVDILFHQVLAILKETSGINMAALLEQIATNPAFVSIPPLDVKLLLKAMIQKGYVEKLRDEFLLGYNAEQIVSKRSFYGVFTADSGYKVIYGDREMGEIAGLNQVQVGLNIFLAGISWRVIEVDKKRKEIYVTKGVEGKKPVFQGKGGNIHRKIRVKMLELLFSGGIIDNCDETSNGVLEDLREEFANFGITDYKTERPLVSCGNRCEFFTFSGTRINKTLQFLFRNLLLKRVYYDERRSAFDLPITQGDFGRLLKDAKELLENFERVQDESFGDDEGYYDFGKWGEFLPDDFKKGMLRHDYFDLPGTTDFLNNLIIKSPGN